MFQPPVSRVENSWRHSADFPVKSRLLLFTAVTSTTCYLYWVFLLPCLILLLLTPVSWDHLPNKAPEPEFLSQLCFPRNPNYRAHCMVFIFIANTWIQMNYIVKHISFSSLNLGLFILNSHFVILYLVQLKNSFWYCYKSVPRVGASYIIVKSVGNKIYICLGVLHIQK